MGNRRRANYNLFMEKDLVNTIYLTKYIKIYLDAYFKYPNTFNITNSSRIMASKDILFNYITLEKDEKHKYHY